MSSPEVITIGYEGRTVDDVIAALVVADVKVVVDVRLTPRSRKAGCRSIALWRNWTTS